jgi:hypothetical protein
MTGSREGVRIRDPPERRETLEPGKVYIAPAGMADDGGTEVAVEEEIHLAKTPSGTPHIRRWT